MLPEPTSVLAQVQVQPACCRASELVWAPVANNPWAVAGGHPRLLLLDPFLDPGLLLLDPSQPHHQVSLDTAGTALYEKIDQSSNINLAAANTQGRATYGSEHSRETPVTLPYYSHGG